MSEERNLNTAGSGLHLNKASGEFLGVCAGLADNFGIDPLIVRLVFVIGALVGFGSLILIYFLIALLAR